MAPPALFADRYRPLFVVGKGGMGRVEVALDEGHAGIARVVALKRQLPEVQEDRLVEMFLREARVAALLDHANVVRAYDYGAKEGELYLAMEYVEGETLAVLLERAGRLDPELAAYVIAELCEGLHAAHELRDAFGEPLGIVHRDVSPHNVMIAYDGRVKLVDFGVAKVDVGSVLTRTGEVKGKAAYMSPEQALGDPLDCRSDLYAVGAVLFECIEGKRMWPGDTDMEVLRRLALEEPPRLADAPGPIAELQSRLVMRERDARPKSAHDVAEELRSLTSGRPQKDAMRARMTEVFGREIEEKKQKLKDALFAATGKQSMDGAPANARPVVPTPPITEKMLGTEQDPAKLALALAPTLAGLTPSATAHSYPPAPIEARPIDPASSTKATRTTLPVAVRWGGPLVLGLVAAAIGTFVFRARSKTELTPPASVSSQPAEPSSTIETPRLTASPSMIPSANETSPPPVAVSALPRVTKRHPTKPAGSASTKPTASSPASASPNATSHVDPNPI